MHKWFKATECPGPYLSDLHPWIASEVNKRLGTLYRVQVGAFASKSNAEQLQKKLKSAGFDAIIKTE